MSFILCHHNMVFIWKVITLQYYQNHIQIQLKGYRCKSKSQYHRFQCKIHDGVDTYWSGAILYQDFYTNFKILVTSFKIFSGELILDSVRTDHVSRDQDKWYMVWIKYYMKSIWSRFHTQCVCHQVSGVQIPQYDRIWCINSTVRILHGTEYIICGHNGRMWTLCIGSAPI